MVVACRWPSSSRLTRPCSRVHAVTPRRNIATGSAASAEPWCQAASCAANAGLVVRPEASAMTGSLLSAERKTFMLRFAALTTSSDARWSAPSQVEKISR
jgi:hypothetical protein